MISIEVFKLAVGRTIIGIKQNEVEQRDGCDSYIITFDTGIQLKLTSGYNQYNDATEIDVQWLNPNDDSE